MKKTILPAILILFVIASFLAAKLHRSSETNSPTQGEKKVLYYVDPMNPTHTSGKPGLAPCGMKMEPVYADSAQNAASERTAAGGSGAVRVSLDKQQLMGVRVGSVEKAPGTRTLRTVGKVAPDETRIFRVSAPVDGLVRNAGPFVSGNLIKKDEVLGCFYNRDFLTAQQTYLFALNTMDRFKDKENEEQMKLTSSQVRAAEDSLEFLGMGKTQMQEVARTRRIARDIEIRSPVSGLVLLRNLYNGLRFERNTELFRVAELDPVWILADVYENEAEYFQPGATARVTLKTQDETVMAKVSTAVPQFDPNSRTLKVRLEAENPDLLLRPDMFVDVELAVQYPETVTVPRDAILDCGKQKTVFVQTGNGVFEPRVIQTGWRSNERIQVKSGLTPGEKIVISGGFLLDSESRMKLAAAAAQPAPPAASSSGMPGAPSAPAQDDAMQRPATVPGVSTAKDPVCGMMVDKVKAKAANRFTESGGVTMYFCSDRCKEQYVKNAAKFADGADAAPPMAKAE